MNKLQTNYLFDSVALFTTIIQTEKIFQIISLILTIISICVSILYTIHKWKQDALKDGKITNEEIENLINDIKNDIINKGSEKDNE